MRKLSVALIWVLTKMNGRNIVVGITTGYGMGGYRDRILVGLGFPHPSRVTLGPIQPSVQCAPGHSRG
jgi:hypothetical protein